MRRGWQVAHTVLTWAAGPRARRQGAALGLPCMHTHTCGPAASLRLRSSTLTPAPLAALHAHTHTHATSARTHTPSHRMTSMRSSSGPGMVSRTLAVHMNRTCATLGAGGCVVVWHGGRQAPVCQPSPWPAQPCPQRACDPTGAQATSLGRCSDARCPPGPTKQAMHAGCKRCSRTLDRSTGTSR